MPKRTFAVVARSTSRLRPQVGRPQVGQVRRPGRGASTECSRISRVLRHGANLHTAESAVNVRDMSRTNLKTEDGRRELCTAGGWAG